MADTPDRFTADFRRDNFLGIEPELSDYNRSRFVVIPAPLDTTTSYMPGTRFGPRAIIDASKQVELFDHELGINAAETAGIHTLPPLEPAVGDARRFLRKIQNIICSILADEKIPVILGGEHSLTLAPVRACAQKYDDLSVLQIDAHLDMRDSYQDSRFSHACVMRRVLDACPRIVNVGGRAWSEPESRLINRLGLKYFTMPKIRSIEEWQEQVIKNLTEHVYLTVDLDGLDPSIMPAVGTPEPGGLGWWDIVELLDKTISECNVIGFDLVELSPVNGMIAPDFVAARLAYRIISRITKKLWHD